jgi:transposase
MPVYPAAARSATTCASPGCLCHDRMPRYPSDLTGEQWAVLEPWAREVMAGLMVAVGRPMVHDLRAMCDAVGYVVKNGIEWRALPADFLSVTWRRVRSGSGGTAVACRWS